MFRTLALFGAVLGSAGITSADDKPDARPAAPALIGTYTIVSGERSGAKIPDEEIRGAMVTFTVDRVAGTDKSKKEFFAATYMIDGAAKPIRIMMTSTTPKAGDKATGIIEVDKDTLKICYNLPGGDVPTEFKTKDKQQCFILKREKPAVDK
jgi:uncharacterized protein (TIGR03067 family)